METLHRILNTIGVAPSDIVALERMRGLTNANYSVKTQGNDFVVRIASAARAEAHGMSRNAEAQVLKSAQKAGLGVEVLYYELPDGHLVTRRVNAETYDVSAERFQEATAFGRIVERVKRIHSLPPVEHVFDPFSKAKATVVGALKEGIELPSGTSRLLEYAQTIRRRWYPLDPAHIALCHNDLFSVNILQTVPALILDWEFAGMGDVFFDLATLLVACDDAHPLGSDHREIALRTYFGEFNDELLAQLHDMIFMVRLHAALWGVVQQMLHVPEPEEFSYKEYTDYMFNQLSSEL